MDRMDTAHKSGNEVAILKPGQRIRPNVSLDKATELVQCYYNITVSFIQELNSYDDNNFLVKGTSENGALGKYTFKILNSMDSQRSGHIQAEHEAMKVLSQNGINCPTPLRNKFGETFALVSVTNTVLESSDEYPTQSNHIIRLLTFVEGNIMHEVIPTPKLLEKVGKYIANVQDIIKDLSFPAVDNYASLWKLSHVMELEKFIYVLQDFPERFSLVKEIIQTYKDKVLPVYNSLERGVLHGDFNEQNIIVTPSSVDPGEYDVHGLIDFADLQVDPYIAELAITICYMMLECVKEGSLIDPFAGAQFVLKGYARVKTGNPEDLEVLKVLIACRLCISLVMSAYTYSMNPGNEYLLVTTKTGWGLLNRIWREKSDQEILALWKDALGK